MGAHSPTAMGHCPTAMGLTVPRLWVPLLLCYGSLPHGYGSHCPMGAQSPSAMGPTAPRLWVPLPHGSAQPHGYGSLPHGYGSHSPTAMGHTASLLWVTAPRLWVPHPPRPPRPAGALPAAPPPLPAPLCVASDAAHIRCFAPRRYDGGAFELFAVGRREALSRAVAERGRHCALFRLDRTAAAAFRCYRGRYRRFDGRTWWESELSAAVPLRGAFGGGGWGAMGGGGGRWGGGAETPLPGSKEGG